MTAIDIIGIAGAAGVALYTLFIALCRVQWGRLPDTLATDPLSGSLTVSIVVVARNEEATIGKLISDINVQTYPAHLTEVILVDDRSDDNTQSEAKTVASKGAVSIRVIQLAMPAGSTGSRKKQAIKEAAALSGSEVLLLTDADCRVSPDWVASHVRYYQQFPETQLVFGAFCFEGSGWFSGLLNLEAMSLSGVSAVTNAMQISTMCSGANLSYRRQLVEQLRPFERNRHIASGDDEFMLHAVQRHFAGGTRYNMFPASLVTTGRPASLAALYHQRRRWAGKWKAYETVWPGLLALVVLAGNAGSLVVMGTFAISQSPLWLGLLLLKWLAEFAFCRQVGRHFHVKGLLRYFLVMEIIYPFYAIFFGIAANFGHYHWKGRVYP